MIQVPASSFNSAADVARDAVATSIGVARFIAVEGGGVAVDVAPMLQIEDVALELQIEGVAPRLHVEGVATDGIVCYRCI
jgi:hypothetical protein